MKKEKYANNGVMLSTASAKVGDTVELTYMGLLKNSGATQVKVHIGYNESWENAETLDMELKDQVFSVALVIKKSGTLNCAFVDPLGNWDNNSGENYSFRTVNATKAAARSKAIGTTDEAPPKIATKPKKAVATKSDAKPKKAAESKKATKPTKTQEPKAEESKKADAKKTTKTKTSAAKKTTK